MYRCATVSVSVTVMMDSVLLTVHSLEAEAVTIATQRHPTQYQFLQERQVHTLQVFLDVPYRRNDEYRGYD